MMPPFRKGKSRNPLLRGHWWDTGVQVQCKGTSGGGKGGGGCCVLPSWAAMLFCSTATGHVNKSRMRIYININPCVT